MKVEATVSARLDRAGTLYIPGQLFRWLSVGVRRIPILMYHSVADEDESALPQYYRIATAPSQFLKQITWLHEQGYQTVSVGSAVHLLQTGRSSAEKMVVITFDDGYLNFCRHAYPALERFGFTATVFLPTASIANRPLRFNGRLCMTWGDVRDLQRRGISFGSHTVSRSEERRVGK